MTWHEVQTKLLEVQKDQQMCIHKSDLTQLGKSWQISVLAQLGKSSQISVLAQLDKSWQILVVTQLGKSWQISVLAQLGKSWQILFVFKYLIAYLILVADTLQCFLKCLIYL